MTKQQYETKKARLEELKDIDDWDERVDEYNALFDEVVAYEEENEINIVRIH